MRVMVKYTDQVSKTGIQKGKGKNWVKIKPQSEKSAKFTISKKCSYYDYFLTEMELKQMLRYVYNSK